MCVNFGQEPFRYDVQALLAEDRARERVELEQIQVDELVVNRLIRDYLLYCGYSKTLNALDAATGIGPATYESSNPWPKTIREQTTGTSNGGVQRMDLETPPPQAASISFAPSATYQWQGEQKRDEDEEEFDEEEGDDDDSADDHDISLYTGSPRFARSEQRMATPPGPGVPQTIVRDAEYDLVLTDGLCDTRGSPYWDSLQFRSEVRSCVLKVRCCLLRFPREPARHCWFWKFFEAGRHRRGSSIVPRSWRSALGTEQASVVPAQMSAVHQLHPRGQHHAGDSACAQGVVPVARFHDRFHRRTCTPPTTTTATAGRCCDARSASREQRQQRSERSGAWREADTSR